MGPYFNMQTTALFHLSVKISVIKEVLSFIRLKGWQIILFVYTEMLSAPIVFVAANSVDCGIQDPWGGYRLVKQP